MSPVLPGVEFITFDKGAMAAELMRLRAVLKARRFDVLLDLQLSIRASLVASLVRAPIKLGFDRARARELQWLFTNAQIRPAADGACTRFVHGLRARLRHRARARRVGHQCCPPEARAYAERLIPDERPTLIISPCSSHPARNWSAQRYAAVADHAIANHGMRVILAGGRSEQERRMGAAIVAAGTHGAIINQIGKDTLPELLGLLSKATVLISPDSGPVHMATMVGTARHRAVRGHAHRARGSLLQPAMVRGQVRRSIPHGVRQTGRRHSLDRENRAPGRHGPDRRERGRRATRLADAQRCRAPRNSLKCVR